MEIAWDCLLVVLVLPFQFLISLEVRFSLLKLLAKENGKMFVQKPYLWKQNIFQKIYYPVVLVRGTQRLFSAIKNICSGKQKSIF